MMVTPSGIYLPYGNPAHAITAVDTDRRIAIRYRGQYASGGVSLSTSDLLLKTYSDSLAGTQVGTTRTISMDATLNTYGELVDAINAYSGEGWYAMPLVPRSYLAWVSSGVHSFLLAAEAECKVRPDRASSANWWGGAALLGDTSSTALTTGFDYVTCYVGNSDLFGASSNGRLTAITSMVFSWANGGTTEANLIYVWAVNPYTKEEYLVGGPYSLGADPANVVVDRADFGADFLVAPPNGFDLCVVAECGAASGAALTAPVISVYGGYFDKRDRLIGRTQWTPSEA